MKKEQWLKTSNGFKKCGKCKACANGMNITEIVTPFKKRSKIKAALNCKTKFAV